MSYNSQFSLLFAIIFIITSCSNNDRHYEFKVFNQTNYTINELEIFIEEDNVEYIAPNDSTGIIKQSCTKEIIGPCGLGFSIKSFSNSTDQFTNTCGAVLNLDHFSESIINHIFIRLDTAPDISNNCSDKIFEISY